MTAADNRFNDTFLDFSGKKHSLLIQSAFGFLKDATKFESVVCCKFNLGFRC